MTVHRFHVPSVRPGVMDLPAGAGLHATRVLRLGEGDVLRVFDAGQEFEATIVAMGKHRVAVDVGAAVASLRERPIPLHLIMSPLKGDLTELVIQKATELGVARISPVVFERTDTVARRDPTEARIERWHRVAASAAEQSGRAAVPRVDPVTSLADAASALDLAHAAEVRVVAAEPSLHHDAGASAAPSGVRSVVVAVGPSGGLSPADLRILTTAGFSPEGFALHTLRSETACLAAVSILGARFR